MIAAMTEQNPNVTRSILNEAVDCANGGNNERAMTLALISIANSLAHQIHDHPVDSAEAVARLAHIFFTKPEDTTFSALQQALRNWRQENFVDNA